MAKLKIIMVLLLLLLPLLSVSAVSYYIAADAVATDSFFLSGKRVPLEFSIRSGSMRYAFSISYNFDLESDIALLDTSFRLDYYPFDSLGFFIGVDAIRYGRFFGHFSPPERNVFFSSITAGWTFSFSYFYFEPRIYITDPAMLVSESLDILKKYFLSYMDIYASLLVGVKL